jgi:hypothetical protein
MSGLRITLMIVAAAAVMTALSLGLAAAERRGWISLHGTGKGSASAAFGVMEEIFSPGRDQARQLQEEQKRVGNRAPTPGDGLDDGPEFTGRYGGRLTIPADRSPGVATPTGQPGAPSSGGGG